MTSQIIEKYTKQFKYLQKQFPLIAKSYYSQSDLHYQIDELLQDIQLSLKEINNENLLAIRRNQFKYLDPLSSQNSKQFAQLTYLKEIKKPINPNQTQSVKPKPTLTLPLHQRPYHFSSFSPSTFTLYPNRALSVKIHINSLETILHPTQSQNSLFPSRFSFHLHHLHHHLKTQLHFDEPNGLSQTGIFVSGRRILANTTESQDQFSSWAKKSTKTLSFKYIFRHSNLEMYEEIFSRQDNENMIFSVTNSQDPSEIIIAMAKINLNEILNSQKRSPQKLIDKSFEKVLYFRKLISFGQVFPIEEMPLMCKIKIGLEIKEEIISPPVQDLDNFFYHEVQQKKGLKTKQPNNKKQVTRSPRKVMDKTPPKRDISDPRLGRSPHHKREYVKQLLNPKHSHPQKSQKTYTLMDRMNQKHKYQKLTCLDQTETYFRLRNYSVILGDCRGERFKAEYLSLIEEQIKPEEIDMHTSKNVFLKVQMLKPLVQIHQDAKIQSGKSQYPDSKSDQDDAISLPEFSIKIKALIGLKNKDKPGKISFSLPFIQKLNKLLLAKNQSGKIIPYAYEITIEPITIFKIEQLTAISQEIQDRSKSMMSSSKKSYDLESSKLILNKIMRLESNIYAFSQSFAQTRFKRYILIQVRNLELHQVNGNFISVYKYLLPQKMEVKQEPSFHIYPYGSVNKVVNSTHGVYSIGFKINANEFLPYVGSTQVREPSQLNKDSILSTSKHCSVVEGSIIIQMAISCCISRSIQQSSPKKQIHEQQKVEKSNEPKMSESKTKNEKNPLVDSGQTKKQKRQFVQIQIFKAKLSLTGNRGFNSSFRQILVKEQDNFCDLDMRFLSKEKSMYTIKSLNPECAYVVNGENFVFSSVNDRLVLQLMKKLRPNQKMDVVLILENWEKCSISSIELKIVNRPPQNKGQVKSEAQIKSESRIQMRAMVNQMDRVESM